jgi:hypothetical protein
MGIEKRGMGAIAVVSVVTLGSSSWRKAAVRKSTGDGKVEISGSLKTAVYGAPVLVTFY